MTSSVLDFKALLWTHFLFMKNRCRREVKLDSCHQHQKRDNDAQNLRKSGRNQRHILDCYDGCYCGWLELKICELLRNKWNVKNSCVSAECYLIASYFCLLMSVSITAELHPLKHVFQPCYNICLIRATEILLLGRYTPVEGAMLA